MFIEVQYVGLNIKYMGLNINSTWDSRRPVTGVRQGAGLILDLVCEPIVCQPLEHAIGVCGLGEEHTGVALAGGLEPPRIKRNIGL